ncbi:MAG: hypothetical protein KatS3mg024_2233 [Armatimonadota bacterium]|nr:MAG: hypothetical protein KatS3mg024_2233 [Armatimonadota bacterium]
MRARILLAIVCILSFGASVGVAADSIWDYQAVNADGTGSHPLVGADPLPENRVTVEGVALAGVAEILNPADMYTIFIQDDTARKGGIQVWSGRFYQGPQWRPAEYVDFQAGDRVRVTGLLANHNGKVFINDRHSGSPETRFSVTVLGHVGLPDPELIPSISNCNFFDPTRRDGGERYQTRLVMLHGVQVGEGPWANNNLLTISDSTGSVGLLLSRMGDFTGNPKPQGPVSVVGIMDQEDATPPFHDAYRVWVKKQADVAVALGSCREVQSVPAGENVALAGKVVSRVFDGFFYIQDEGRSGGVRVLSGRDVTAGEVVSVLGPVVEEDGEKAVAARYIAFGKSRAMPLTVGGGLARLGTSLGPDGLLVRVPGTAGPATQDGFTLLEDGGQSVPVKLAGGAPPQSGTRVAVTGVAANRSGVKEIETAHGGDIRILE